MRPVWLKIAAAPLGQPGSVSGLLPSPPVINAKASGGLTTARRAMMRPVVILVMVFPLGEHKESPIEINVRGARFLAGVPAHFSRKQSRSDSNVSLGMTPEFLNESFF